ncbi:MAG TPA: riboflavin synthase [Gemmatimonadales bacterium]
MFTGIVTAVGRVQEARPAGAGLDLAIASPYADLDVGESIAVNGACLTVTGTRGGTFDVHVVATTLERTCLGELAAGSDVNLERALRAGDRLGGHLVQGHVDGIGTVESVREHGDARLLDIRVPAAVAEVTVPLGSITVDGVSLTVNALPAPGVVQVSLIPFTFQHTTLGARRAGDRVQLEGDTIGKYVKALVRP